MDLRDFNGRRSPPRLRFRRAPPAPRKQLLDVSVRERKRVRNVRPRHKVAAVRPDGDHDRELGGRGDAVFIGGLRVAARFKQRKHLAHESENVVLVRSGWNSHGRKRKW
jgi:hypothetical protein